MSTIDDEQVEPKRRNRRQLGDGLVSEWVARSRAEQGLPLTITDPGALARVAAIFATATGSAGGSP